MFCWAVEMGKGTSDTEKFCAVPQYISLGVVTVSQLNCVIFGFPSVLFTTCLYADESAVAGPRVYITSPIMPGS